MNNRRFFITQDKSKYYPGETIHSKVFFTPEKEGHIKEMQISFILDEAWFNLYDSSKNSYNNNIQIISQFNINLKKLLPNQEIQPGSFFLTKKTYNFPFDFKLPDFSNPSFEYPTAQYRAHLRYIIDAKIKSNEFPGNTSTYILILAIPKLDLNNLKIEKSLAVKKWGLFDIGSTVLKASYPTKNYKFSDTIPIQLNIDNAKSKLKVKECKIDFVRIIIFRDKLNLKEKKKLKEKLIKNVIPTAVGKHEIKNFTHNIKLGDFHFKNLTFEGYKNPYEQKSYSDINLVPSVDGGIISCEYSIKITAYYDSFVKKSERPRIILPVYMVHKLENGHIEDAQEQADILKAIEESKKLQEKKEEKISWQEEQDIQKAIEESKREEELRKRNMNNQNNNMNNICNQNINNNIYNQNNKFNNNNYNQNNNLYCNNNVNSINSINNKNSINNINEVDNDEMLLPSKTFLYNFYDKKNDLKKEVQNININSNFNNNSILNNNFNNNINNNNNLNNQNPDFININEENKNQNLNFVELSEKNNNQNHNEKNSDNKSIKDSNNNNIKNSQNNNLNNNIIFNSYYPSFDDDNKINNNDSNININNNNTNNNKDNNIINNNDNFKNYTNGISINNSINNNNIDNKDNFKNYTNGISINNSINNNNINNNDNFKNYTNEISINNSINNNNDSFTIFSNEININNSNNNDNFKGYINTSINNNNFNNNDINKINDINYNDNMIPNNFINNNINNMNNNSNINQNNFINNNSNNNNLNNNNNNNNMKSSIFRNINEIDD